MTTLPPRLIIAGTHSGVGKTSIATGLMAALGRAGHRVGAAKVGPDFIDPGYHSVAVGRPSRNLDAWMCGEAVQPSIAARAAAGADVLVVEGVMGLFDGSADPDEPGAGSTAHIARILQAPVVLVVDASAMSGSVAALVHGFATFDPSVGVAGVILNRVASDSHELLLREALGPLGLPVLGAVRRDDRLTWRDRHLGLVPVAEDPDAVRAALVLLADAVAATCDLEALVRVARSAPPLEVATDGDGAGAPASDAPDASGASDRARPVRIAVAGGRAFTFTYPDNLDALVEAGAELVPFDPLDAPGLPDGVDGLIAGGGFPEVFGAALADNRPLLADVATRVGRGLVTWAECGGLLWLARSLDGHPLAGVIAADATMTDRLSMGYRRATVRVPNPLAPVGSEIRGHEFHYSHLDPPGDALELVGRTGTVVGGHATPSLLASYLHVHLAARPDLARTFVASCARSAR